MLTHSLIAFKYFPNPTFSVNSVLITLIKMTNYSSILKFSFLHSTFTFEDIRQFIYVHVYC